MKKTEKKICKVCGLQMSMHHSRESGNCSSSGAGFSEAKQSWENQPEFDQLINILKGYGG